MVSNSSQAVLVDFGSMTPGTIEMRTRSEAQRWQVKRIFLLSMKNVTILVVFSLRIGQKRIAAFNVNMILYISNDIDWDVT